MKRIVWGLVGVAVTMAMLAGIKGDTQAASAGNRAKTVQVPWRKYKASGDVDSLSVGIKYGGGELETTAVISTSGWDHNAGGTNPDVAKAIARVRVQGSFESVDTLFYFLECSPDGVNFLPTTTAVNVLKLGGGAAGVAEFAINADANVAALNEDNAHLCPFFRVRFRGDGNTAASIANAKFYLTYLEGDVAAE